MHPRVVSSAQLASILSRHPCFCDQGVVDDLAGVIAEHARTGRWTDLVQFLRPCFRAWASVMLPSPRPRVPSNVPHMGDPVSEFLCYRGHYFFRERHSVGVTLATFVIVDDRRVGVVWTTTHTAYLFRHVAERGWVVARVLEGQDDPFRTWMEHLGGAETLAREGPAGRSAERLFHDLVVPYFGTHPHARDPIRMRAISAHDAVWELVRRISYVVVPAEDPRRYAWIPLFSP